MYWRRWWRIVVVCTFIIMYMNRRTWKKNIYVYVQRTGHGNGQGRWQWFADGAYDGDRTSAVQLQAEHLAGQYPDQTVFLTGRRWQLTQTRSAGQLNAIGNLLMITISLLFYVILTFTNSYTHCNTILSTWSSYYGTYYYCTVYTTCSGRRVGLIANNTRTTKSRMMMMMW